MIIKPEEEDTGEGRHTEEWGAYSCKKTHSEPQNGCYFKQRNRKKFQHFGRNAYELVALHRYKDNINSSKIHNLDHTHCTELRIRNNNGTKNGAMNLRIPQRIEVLDWLNNYTLLMERPVPRS